MKATNKTSYGRMNLTAIGGLVAPGEYRHIEQYEKEILELREQGLLQGIISKTS